MWSNVSSVSVWHDGINISILEEKTLEDLSRSGRPKWWDIENIGLHRVLEENLQEGTRRLSEEVEALKDTIHPQIETLGKSYRSCRSVPPEFTRQQAQRRADVWRQRIGNLMDDDLSGGLSHVVKNWSLRQPRRLETETRTPWTCQGHR